MADDPFDDILDKDAEPRRRVLPSAYGYDGGVLDHIREAQQLLPTDDPGARMGGTLLAELTQKLLAGLPEKIKTDLRAKQIDPEKILIEPRISAIDGINACIYPHPKKSLTVFYRGLLKEARNVDEIAGILSHEINHRIFQALFDGEKNSQMQEAYCDLNSLETLRNAGFKQDAAIDFLRRLDQGKQCFLSTATDPHPLTSNRVRALEIAEEKLNREQGQQNPLHRIPKPKPRELDAALGRSVFRNDLQAALDNKNYATAGPAEKLNILAEAIREYQVEHYREMDYRIDNITAELKALKDSGFQLDERDGQQVRAFNWLLKEAIHAKGIDHSGQYRSEGMDRHSAAIHNYDLMIDMAAGCVDPKTVRRDGGAKYTLPIDYTRQSPPKPFVLLGRLAELREAKECFIAAASEAEAADAAATILSVYRELARNDTARPIMRLVHASMPDFAVPEQALKTQEGKTAAALQAVDVDERPAWLQKSPGLAPPWQRQAQWARDNEEIRNALRLFPEASQQFPLGEMREPSYGGDGTWQLTSYYTDELRPEHRYRLNAKGEIHGRIGEITPHMTLPTPEARREHRLKKRARSEREIVEKDKWRQMIDRAATSGSYSSTYEFKQKYADYLVPEYDFQLAGGKTLSGMQGHDPVFITAVLQYLTEKASGEDGKGYRSFLEGLLHEASNTSMGDTARGRSERLVRQDGFEDPSSTHIPAENPYIRLALDNPGGVLSPLARLRMINASDWHRSEGLENVENTRANSALFLAAYQTKPWDMLGVPEPVDGPTAKAAFAQLAEQFGIRHHRYSGNGALTVAMHECARQHLIHNEKAVVPFEDILPYMAFAHGSQGHGQLPDEERFIPLLQDTAARSLKAALASGIDTDRLIGMYRAYSCNIAPKGDGLMPSAPRRIFDTHPDMRRQCEALLKERFAAEKDMDAKARWAKALLYSDSIALTPHMAEKQRVTLDYDGSAFKDPELAPLLAGELVKAEARRVGRHVLPSFATPEHPANDDAIKAVADEMVARTSGKVRYDLLVQFAEATEAQRDLCNHIEREIRHETIRDLAGNSLGIGLSQPAIETFCKTPQNRFGLIAFLRRPLSADSIQRFEKEVDAKELHIEIAPGFSMGDRSGVAYTDLPPHLRHDFIRSLHEHFWTLPDEFRAVAGDLLLFPTKDYSQETFRQGRDYVAEQVFPIKKGLVAGLLNRGANRDHIIARDVIDAGLGHTSEAAKRLMLSAILFGAKPEGKRMSRGQALNQLDYLEPAGGKVKQGINSWPDTPQDIKDATRDSKTRFKVPPRWEVINWLEKEGPDTAESGPKIRRYGKIFGAGSYGVTIGLDKADGSHTACTILREQAEQRAFENFTFLEQTTETAAAKHKQLAPVIPIIRHQKQNGGKETDMALAAEQASVAGRITNGFRVTVNGTPVDFAIAPWVGHGKRYKETRIVDGEHFNDLPEATAQERDAKWQFATANVAKQLYVRLAGLPADHDRHGGQERDRVVTEGGRVRLLVQEFDHGGQAVEFPPDEEKRVTAGIIARAIGRSLGPLKLGLLGQKLEAAFNAETEAAIRAHPDMEMKLAEFKRDILAMQDHFAAAERLKPGSVKAILGAIFRTGHVDPVIAETMKRELGPAVYAKMQEAGVSGISLALTPPPEADRLRGMARGGQRLREAPARSEAGADMVRAYYAGSQFGALVAHHGLEPRIEARGESLILHFAAASPVAADARLHREIVVATEQFLAGHGIRAAAGRTHGGTVEITVPAAERAQAVQLLEGLAGGQLGLSDEQANHALASGYPQALREIFATALKGLRSLAPPAPPLTSTGSGANGASPLLAERLEQRFGGSAYQAFSVAVRPPSPQGHYGLSCRIESSGPGRKAAPLIVMLPTCDLREAKRMAEQASQWLADHASEPETGRAVESPASHAGRLPRRGTSWASRAEETEDMPKHPRKGTPTLV